MHLSYCVWFYLPYFQCNFVQNIQGEFNFCVGIPVYPFMSSWFDPLAKFLLKRFLGPQQKTVQKGVNTTSPRHSGTDVTHLVTFDSLIHVCFYRAPLVSPVHPGSPALGAWKVLQVKMAKLASEDSEVILYVLNVSCACFNC